MDTDPPLVVFHAVFSSPDWMTCSALKLSCVGMFKKDRETPPRVVTPQQPRATVVQAIQFHMEAELMYMSSVLWRPGPVALNAAATTTTTTRKIGVR